jgi:hypothetical protein
MLYNTMFELTGTKQPTCTYRSLSRYTMPFSMSPFSRSELTPCRCQQPKTSSVTPRLSLSIAWGSFVGDLPRSLGVVKARVPLLIHLRRNVNLFSTATRQSITISHLRKSSLITTIDIIATTTTADRSISEWYCSSRRYMPVIPYRNPLTIMLAGQDGSDRRVCSQQPNR